MAAISENKNSTVQTITVQSGSNLDLNTTSDNKPVRINSRSYTQTSGSSIAFQAKPSQTVTSTGDVIGCEIQPRVAQGIGCGSLIGAEFGPVLKGTSGAGTLSGDMRGCQVDLTDENVAGRTVSGDVVGMRYFQQLAAHTISGDVVVWKIEAAGGATAWEFLAKLPDDGQISNSTGTPTTGAGWLKFKIGSATRYALLYSTAP